METTETTEVLQSEERLGLPESFEAQTPPAETPPWMGGIDIVSDLGVVKLLVVATSEEAGLDIVNYIDQRVPITHALNSVYHQALDAVTNTWDKSDHGFYETMDQVKQIFDALDLEPKRHNPVAEGEPQAPAEAGEG